MIRPDQRMIRGSRVPPSYIQPLPSASGALLVGDPLGGGQPAVVRGEDDHGVFGQPRLFQCRQKPPDVPIEVLNHRRIGGVRLNRAAYDVLVFLVLAGKGLPRHERIDRVQAHSTSLGLILGPVRRLDLNRNVHGIVPEVKEERPAVILADQADGLVGQPIGQVLSRRPIRQRFDPPRAEVAILRLPPVAAADVHVEAMLLGKVRLLAQVPLADVPRAVARVLQSPGQTVLRQRQVVDVRRVDESPLGVRADPVRHTDAGRVSAGQEAGPARRADGAGRIGIRKPHALAGQPIEIRRLVEHAAVTAEILPAKIIDENEDEIRPAHASHRSLISLMPVRPAAPPASGGQPPMSSHPSARQDRPSAPWGCRREPS